MSDTAPRVLTGFDVTRRKMGGDIVLTWSTSRMVSRQIETIPGEFEEIEIAEPITVSETVSFVDDDLEVAIETYKRQLGVA